MTPICQKKDLPLGSSTTCRLESLEPLTVFLMSFTFCYHIVLLISINLLLKKKIKKKTSNCIPYVFHFLLSYSFVDFNKSSIKKTNRNCKSCRTQIKNCHRMHTTQSQCKITFITSMPPLQHPHTWSNDSYLHVVEPSRRRSFIWQIGVNSSIQDQRQV